MKPIYSICISNYNMAETIQSSLESILKYLDSKFEVVVIDDGSDDNSLKILDSLVSKYSLLRVIPLLRDNRRKLGETRNISVRAARGKYVLLHIDTDDVWEPYIESFTKIFHELEKRFFLEDFMLSGNQIQMATKKLILDNPYPNVYYVEDRIMWNNLAILGKLFYLEHKVFRKRIPIKSKKKKLYKSLKTNFSSMCVAFSYSPSARKTFMDYLRSIKNNSNNSKSFSIITLLLLIPSLINGRFFSRIALHNQFKGSYESLHGEARRRNIIKLNVIEKDYFESHGLFELDQKERKIFLL